MNNRMHVVRTIGCTLAVSLAFSSYAHAQDAGATPYKLNPGSTFQTGCFPPCLCPLSQEFQLRGSFSRSFIGSSFWFDHYVLSDIAWEVVMKDASHPPLPIVGSGTYQIGGDFALAHRLKLDLRIGDNPPQHFDSGLVVGGSEFPDFKIMVSMNDMFCYDTVIVVDASPVGACCLPNAAGLPSCIITSRKECFNEGGAYQGDGTLCPPPDSTVPCGPPTGACCLNDSVGNASCFVNTEEKCADEGGAYQGDGTTCPPPDSTVPCGPPTGACCLNNPAGNVSCFVGSEEQCFNEGGSYQGHGTTCPSDPNVPCGAPCALFCPASQGCFSGCGVLVQGAECVLFKADSGGLFILSNLGGFGVGDKVSVTGCHDPDCISHCMQGNGCIVNNNTIEPCGRVCGGIQGLPCDPGEFCKLGVGQCCCDFQGICTPIPTGCFDVWDPVCGCDGVTYGNECEADAAGVSIDHLGECESICHPSNDGSACVPLACSAIPEDRCIATVVHLDIGTGAITAVVCECLDFNLCHVEFGDATPFPVGICLDGGTCEVIGTDTDNDGIDDLFRAECVPSGACCLPVVAGLPPCIITTEKKCFNEGGAYQGHGTTCPPDGTVPCGSPIGACCLNDSVGNVSCFVGTEQMCHAEGGAYQGNGSTCPPDGTVPCGPPTGACCLNNVAGDVSCFVGSQKQCLNKGGAYQGDGTTCPSDPSVPCGVPCNLFCAFNQSCFSGCGVLVQGVECVLFRSDSGGLFILSNLGGFTVGNRVSVTGCHDPHCISFCMQGNGCIVNNTIEPCGQICGGIQGIPCDDPAEFCKLGIGRCCCDFQGICTPMPKGCFDVWDPVCGCDGVTYGNECEADAVGVSIDHLGECETGACCLPNAAGLPSCVITTQHECLNEGGAYQGHGTTCPSDFTTPCGVPAGACCFSAPGDPNAVCSVTTELECVVNGGRYQGDNTPCDAILCHLPPTGACCVENAAGNASCFVGTQEECSAEGGVYQGEGTTCPTDAATPCGGTSGACCFSSDDTSHPHCLINTFDACIAEGGIYQGDDTVCEPNVCNCCFEDGTCINMPGDVCTAEGGTLRGDPAIPTVSQWGLVITVLLVLTCGTVVFGRRRAPSVI
ncbi:MAG: hypothetical protein V3W34_17915 [Phycisphaerae bacterium]